MRVLFLIFTVLSVIQVITCARILGVFFFPGYSHFVLGEALFKELASKGHEVTVVSAFPQKEKVDNYIDVPITSLNDIMEGIQDPENFKKMLKAPKIFMLLHVFSFGIQMVDGALEDQNFKDLLNSKQTFDVIIVEHFFSEALIGLSHRFNAPIITMATSASSIWTNRLHGNPTPYATIPHLILNLPPKMNLFHRTYNSLVTTFENIFYNIWIYPQQNEILHKHFPDAPQLVDLMSNVSLIFLNSHPVFGSPVPLLPNMIEIGGFHVQAQEKQTLHADLKKYLDDAKEGVVYFSMGSNLKSKDLDQDKLDHILKTFSKLKMKVLWKWEAEELPGKPANVRTEKWLPQSAVLAHKNVKIFITHGGKLSTTESIYHGKPVLGIPMFAEQHANIQEAAYYGYGLHVAYDTLTEDALTEALTELIQNPKYAKEAKYRSSALKNLQSSPLDTAVHWVEYVIQHGGAPHLRNPALNISLYKYLLIDVLILCLTTIWLSKKLLGFICRKLFGGSNTPKYKVN